MGIKPFPGTACESWISSSPSSTQLRNKPGREPHPFPTTPSQGSTQVAGNIAGWPLASHLEEKCCPLKHSSCMGTVSTSLVYLSSAWPRWDANAELLSADSTNYRGVKTETGEFCIQTQSLDWTENEGIRKRSFWVLRENDFGAIRKPGWPHPKVSLWRVSRLPRRAGWVHRLSWVA